MPDQGNPQASAPQPGGGGGAPGGAQGGQANPLQEMLGKIAMLARQLGHPIPAKTGFGMWEWGTLSKEANSKR